jgi:RNA polymerase sigma-70 factor (ECF subfamily)
MTDRFATTQWSVVLAAAHDPAGAGDALADLCATYWYPLYAHVRRRGHDEHDARDLTQGFFAALLERGFLRRVDRDRGRFRGFLVTAFRRFVKDEREKDRAIKRGGGARILSLDFEDGESRYRREPADDLTPERIYERQWALTVLDRVLFRLREEHAAAGRGAVFRVLAPYLEGASPTLPYADAAERLETSVGAVKVTVHRLRRRYRALLREEIARTVSDLAEVEDELRHLVTALS